ncbi:hypothetical protein [Streptomyces thermolilacinus]|uniref:hypothetical protein n=1 Tax=Streptomyces thermolilacinus TaxID=285540 RepID=UPI0033D6F196
MAAFTSDDLRALADALDGLTETTSRTGVQLQGYNDTQFRLHDHVMHLLWLPGDDVHATASGETLAARPGRYAVEFPDMTY